MDKLNRETILAVLADDRPAAIVGAANRVGYLTVGLVRDLFAGVADLDQAIERFLDKAARATAAKETLPGQQERRTNGRTAKLTADQVADIRASNEPAEVLAARYVVSVGTIGGILNYRSWHGVGPSTKTVPLKLAANENTPEGARRLSPAEVEAIGRQRQSDGTSLAALAVQHRTTIPGIVAAVRAYRFATGRTQSLKSTVALTVDDIALVQQLNVEGRSISKIAAATGVGVEVIKDVKAGRRVA